MQKTTKTAKVIKGAKKDVKPAPCTLLYRQ